ncbi:hypothetical protein HNR46_001869 [Haloferula luteola]|uniref:Uncharacterized protein n=1 Tax=Haloferula luteola TaxID=595692 RepID=A0A840VCI6_9BACT|nr:hypothetical protein [Haloferula luteola]
MRRLLADRRSILANLALCALSCLYAISFWSPRYFVYSESDTHVQLSILSSLRGSPISVLAGGFALVFLAMALAGLSFASTPSKPKKPKRGFKSEVQH